MAIKGKKILYLDDELLLGELVQCAIERHGGELTHFARVRMAGEDIILMNPDGKESTLERGAFDFAFVDGRIKGSALDGWDVTPHMVRLGIPVVAVSGVDDLNDLMIKAGASRGVRKDKLWDTLRDGTFSL